MEPETSDSGGRFVDGGMFTFALPGVERTELQVGNFVRQVELEGEGWALSACITAVDGPAHAAACEKLRAELDRWEASDVG